MKRTLFIVITLVMVTFLFGCSCDNKLGQKQPETTTVNMEKDKSLYGSVLKEYADACKSSKTKDIEAKQKLSTGFGEVAKEKNLSKRLGYKFVDLNRDGTDELLVSLIDKKDKLNNYVIAVYSYGGEGAKRILEGWSRNVYYQTKDGLILNEASGGAEDAEIAKLQMKEDAFVIYSMLSIKYGKKDKVNYLYASVGKPLNKKQYRISEKAWRDKVGEWEKEVVIDGVTPFSKHK